MVLLIALLMQQQNRQQQIFEVLLVCATLTKYILNNIEKKLYINSLCFAELNELKQIFHIVPLIHVPGYSKENDSRTLNYFIQLHNSCTCDQTVA